MLNPAWVDLSDGTSVAADCRLGALEKSIFHPRAPALREAREANVAVIILHPTSTLVTLQKSNAKVVSGVTRDS